MRTREEILAEGTENAFRALLEVLLDLRDQNTEALEHARYVREYVDSVGRPAETWTAPVSADTAPTNVEG